MYMYICIYIYICICVHTQIYIYRCMYVYMYIYVYIHIFIYIHINIYIYIYRDIYICIYVHIYTYAYIYIRVYICTYVYILHIHTHISLYSYVYIFNTHTRKHKTRSAHPHTNSLPTLDAHTPPNTPTHSSLTRLAFQPQTVLQTIHTRIHKHTRLKTKAMHLSTMLFQVDFLGCLIFIGHFLQKSPTVSGSFAERDLQLSARCTAVRRSSGGNSLNSARCYI